MSKGNDTKQGESAVESPLGGFGTGAGMALREDGNAQGTVTGRWDSSAVKNGKPPSVRGVAYVNRETARRLLQGMIKEFRDQAARSEADGYMTDADNFNRWAEQGEVVLGLTLGGG